MEAQPRPPPEEPSPPTEPVGVPVGAPVGGSNATAEPDPRRREIGAVWIDVSLEDFEITSAGLDHDSKGLFRAATKPDSLSTAKGLRELYFIKQCADEETFLQGMDRAKLLTSITDGVSHPNVAVVEFGFKAKVGDDPAYYMAMPWYPMTLHEWFTAQSGQVENLPEMIRVLSEMVSGLSWLHSQGLFREGSTPVQIWMDSAELLAKPKWLAADCSPIPQGVLPTNPIGNTLKQLVKIVKSVHGQKCSLTWTFLNQLVISIDDVQRHPALGPLHPSGASRESVLDRLHDIRTIVALELQLELESPTEAGIAQCPPKRYVDAFEGNLNTSTAWSGLGVVLRKAGKEAEVKGKRYSRQQCFIEALQRDPNSSFAWFQLGRSANVSEQVTVNGKTFGKCECYIEALTCHPEFSSAWSALGYALADDAEVTINGALYRKIDCFVQTLKCNPEAAEAWNNIGLLLAPGELITINGAQYSERMCYAEALRLNPKDPYFWNNLALTMSASESTTVLGRDFSQRDCLVEALKHDPEDANCWVDIGVRMSDSEQVLVNGVYYTKRQCCVQALTFNPLDDVAWEMLGCGLPSDGKAAVKDKTYTMHDCLLEALRLNPKRECSWANLAYTMKPTEKVLVNGTPYTQRECYLEALKINTKLREVWYNLSSILTTNDMILVDGMSYTKQDCMAKYDELCKSHEKQMEDSSEGCPKISGQVGGGDVDESLRRLQREAESRLLRATLHRWFDLFFLIDSSPNVPSKAKRLSILDGASTVIRCRSLIRSQGGRAKVATEESFMEPQRDRMAMLVSTLVHGRSAEDNLQLVEAVHRSRVHCLGVKAIPTAEFLGSYCSIEGHGGRSPSTAAASDYFLHGGAGFPFPPLPVHRPSGQLMSPALLSAIQAGGLNGGVGRGSVPESAEEALHRPLPAGGIDKGGRLEVELYVVSRPPLRGTPNFT